jgi:hypothetical protein
MNIEHLREDIRRMEENELENRALLGTNRYDRELQTLKSRLVRLTTPPKPV